MASKLGFDYVKKNLNVPQTAIDGIKEKPYVELNGGGEVKKNEIIYEIPRENSSDNKGSTSAGNNSSGNVTVVIEQPEQPEDNIAARKDAAKTEYESWKSKSEPQYTSKYSTDIENALKTLSEREFSYDPFSDPAYQRYRDSVKTSAQLAMADAVGLSAALNGGYSTSYAQLAGQSAYMNSMKEADLQIPELYEAAYKRFSDETDDLEDSLELLRELENDEWDKYTDILSDHREKGQELYDRYTELSDEEFDRFYSMYKLTV